MTAGQRDPDASATEYLLRSPVNAARLIEAINRLEQRATGDPLTPEVANAVYDVLVAHAGAAEAARADFILDQTLRHIEEYRFRGELGFGGKFWRDRGRRWDGSYGERWRVSACPEDMKRFPEIVPAIEATNEALTALQKSLLGECQ